MSKYFYYLPTSPSSSVFLKVLFILFCLTSLPKQTRKTWSSMYFCSSIKLNCVITNVHCDLPNLPRLFDPDFHYNFYFEFNNMFSTKTRWNEKEPFINDTSRHLWKKVKSPRPLDQKLLEQNKERQDKQESYLNTVYTSVVTCLLRTVC